jgi:uncharacterized protein (DUF2141 family)
MIAPLTLLLLGFWQQPPANACTLTIHVDGFRNQKGDLGATIFKSSAGWPEDNDKAFMHQAFPIQDSHATATFHLPPGKYSVGVLHDENKNHKLDRNMFHFPKEGFGFANNPKVGLAPPPFDAAQVTVGCPDTAIDIHLIYK